MAIKEEVFCRLDSNTLKVYETNKFPICIWFQAHYTSTKGKISLVHLGFSDLFLDDNRWEIYCLEGNLFEDIERFDNLQGALKRIYKLLKE